jgi:TM2 domain-containing membrane protein YozV
VPYGHQAAPAYGYVQPNPSMQQTAALMQRKSSGLAIFLSFLLPGLGQFYGGSPGKGVLFLVFDMFNVVLLFFLIGFVTAPICWIWSMIDASSTVDRYNARVLMTAYGAPPAY